MIPSERPMIHSSDEVDVVALLAVVWRYKFFIALVAGVCGLVAVYLALTATPVFRAQVVVTQASDEGVSGASSLMSRFGGLASIAGLDLSNDGLGYEAQAILRSRRLAQEFISRNELTGVLLPNNSKASSLWFAVRSFRESVIEILDDDDNGTTTIAISWSDPEVAARWANDYVALANEIIRTRALEDANRNIRFLTEQISKTDVVEVQRVMYSIIESETKTQMLANAREEYAFAVVDPAVAPEQRVWPRRTLMVLTGTVIGILIGLMLAFAHNAWSVYRTREPTSRLARDGN